VHYLITSSWWGCGDERCFLHRRVMRLQSARATVPWGARNRKQTNAPFRDIEISSSDTPEHVPTRSYDISYHFVTSSDK
jgi:hypothetical protein